MSASYGTPPVRMIVSQYDYGCKADDSDGESKADDSDGESKADDSDGESKADDSDGESKNRPVATNFQFLKILCATGTSLHQLL